jgi:putative tricarboxylic transport membrane protein
MSAEGAAPMSLVRRGDFWSGLALALLGAWIVSQARGWTYMGEDGPGPGFFPMWYGSLMVALSLVLVAGAALRSVREPGKELEPGSNSLEPGSNWLGLGRALACWAAFVACIVLMKGVGFPIAFAALTWFIVAVMARQSKRLAFAIAIGGALLFYALFELALEVPLPPGLLF